MKFKYEPIPDFIDQFNMSHIVGHFWRLFIKPARPVNRFHLHFPSLPGVEGAWALPRATPARGTPADQAAGGNANGLEAVSMERN
jgi:hypothetical protein